MTVSTFFCRRIVLLHGCMFLWSNTVCSGSFILTTSAITYRRKAWQQTGTYNSSSRSNGRTIPLFVKPPAKLLFDLAAIEKLEEELLSKRDESIDSDPFWEEDENWSTDTSAEDVFYTVPSDLHNGRIDSVVATMLPNLSRSQCAQLVQDGFVSITSVGDDTKTQIITRKSSKVEQGMVVSVKLVPQEKITEIVPQNIPLTVLYEDAHMIVLNKNAGMVVHPAAGNWDGTIVNALAFYLSKKSPFGSGDFITSSGSVLVENSSEVEVEGTDGESCTFRPGIVHRLDKGTTGVLVIAKTRQALANLSAAFANRQVKKTYLAITVGNPGKRVVIDKPIGRHPINRQKMRVVPELSKSTNASMKNRSSFLSSGKTPTQGGRRAISYVNTLAFDSKLSLVEVRIETGRTHQIRVHLQDRSTPIYGDDVYGLPDWNKRLMKSHGISRPLLHAFKMEIHHPVTGDKMVFQAPMSKDMLSVTESIWNDGRIQRPDIFLETTS